jgi:quercetin dioxygenase-like cupin family protein
MKTVGNIKELQGKVMNSDTVKNTEMKVLIGPEQGWDDHVMRMMEVGVDGFTPKHSHPWPHINLMIEGEGVLMIEGVDHKMEAGSYAYVPADALHQFRNTGKTTFKFMCIVPEKGHVY